MFSQCFCGLSPGTSTSSHKPKTYKHNGSTGNSELSIVVRTTVGCLSVWPCNVVMACWGCTPTFAPDSWERLQSFCRSHCGISSDKKRMESEPGSSLHREDFTAWQHYHFSPVHHLSFWGNGGSDYSPSCLYVEFAFSPLAIVCYFHRFWLVLTVEMQCFSVGVLVIIHL